MKEKNPKVSVIIPSLDGYRDGNVPRLLEDISRQSYRKLEVFVVKAVKPCGRAHNHGAQRAKGRARWPGPHRKRNGPTLQGSRTQNRVDHPPGFLKPDS